MFEVSIREGYRGWPDAKERLNYHGLVIFRTKEQAGSYIDGEIAKIYDRFKVLKDSRYIEHNVVVCKVLYEARNGHGRCLRTYQISWTAIQPQDFSLI